MINSVDVSIITIVSSIIGSASVAMWRINVLSKNLDEEVKAVKAIGSKLDVLKNDFTKMNSEFDKDIHFSKTEIDNIKREMLKRNELEECVKKHECNVVSGQKANTNEIELKFMLLKKDISHLTGDMNELKDDTKKILEYITGGLDDSENKK